MWKGEHQGHPVAAKVLRVYSTSDFDKIRRVGCLHSMLEIRVGKLTRVHAEVLQRSNDVEDPLSSKRVTTAGSDNEQ